ncbi:MAG TPA: hypothetical protein VJH20_04530 [Candidatus Nanoarchaeia archaeon]|nr:hypothetical protein [Candidatus Nanoarchaeia archaeon]
MQQKKGQAAMEFLMTYGWAILAAIVAIGVLAYFGVFSPGNLTGSSAIVNNPFYASSWQATSGSESNITLELINNGGDTVMVTNVSVMGTGASTITCSMNRTGGVTMNPGQLTLFSTSECSGDLTAGDNYAGDIIIKYYKSGSSLNQTATGTIRTNII